MEIYRLIPECKNYIWGGEKLPQKYGKNVDFRPVAESWELSVHKDGKTRLESGETIDTLDAKIFGTACAEFDFFPVLIKLIDAKQNLSVQVHPDDAYALANEDSLGKTEAWYIVEADEGAGIYLGFSRDVTREEFEGAIRDQTLTELLNFYPVKAGECYFIPAGTIHAIGAGCLICEIQQNSNLTYRVYDYGRRDKNGNERELHVDKAMLVTDLKRYERVIPVVGDDGEDVLASCRYFHATRITVSGECKISTDARSFKCLTCVRGAGRVGEMDVAAGDSLLVPANFGEVTLSGEMEIVCTQVI
jgi:mannose-6-phosphate isomerase